MSVVERVDGRATRQDQHRKGDIGIAALIPFVDLSRQHAALDGELHAAFDRVLGASAFTLGAEVEAFENEFADYSGTGHCVGVASGTAALTLGLLAAGVGPGDEVIVPGHTFIASALGVLHAGATPVFCEVLDDTGLIDAASARAVVTERTAAILAVHLYGQCCDMNALSGLARGKGLLLMEDAAQAHGATYEGRRAGALGDLAAFSFYPSKNLGALGDAGAICTADDTIAATVRSLRHLGQQTKGEHVVVGYNERLDGLQAAFLRAKLPRLDGWNAARRGHAARLAAGLAPSPLSLITERENTPCVYHLFPVRTEDRLRWVQRLGAAGIATGVHYFPSAHRHAAFDALGPASRPLELPIAEAWAAEEISLPMFPELTAGEVDAIITACLVS